jgi:hypothetical protein
MADDLEAFLRQAARRRAAKKRRKIEILEQPVAEAEIVDSKPPVAPPTRPSPTHPAKPPSQFEARAAELGSKVGQADDVMEARLHDTFDHQIGGLRELTPEPAAARGSSGVDASMEIAKLVRILQDPDSIRQAIILREIIDRPEHRW